MSGDNYYLLCALPALGDLGSDPAIRPGELLDKVRETGANVAVLEALYLGDDLLQRQAFLAGEIEQVAPVILTASQVRGEESLPEYLDVLGMDGPAQSTPDALWEKYYRYAAGVAERERSEFLDAWIRGEVGLRNAVAMARAKALGLDPHAHQVAPELGRPAEDFASLINEWVSATDPLVGLRVLDTARWRWIEENDARFTFEDDELAAYGARLLLLNRWYRLSEEGPARVSRFPMGQS